MQNITAILDIGSGWIKTVVIGEEEGKKTTLHKSLMITKGIRKGKILDSELLRKSIEGSIQEINKKLGEEYIDEYVVSLSHPKAYHERIREQKRIMKEKVTYEDVKHLSNIVADISEEKQEELIKIVPIHWIIDEDTKVKDPTGLHATKLDIVADVYYIPQAFYNAFVEIIESIDIYVVDIIPNILATAEATLDYDTKDLGCISIDIGKEQTSFIVYEEGYPLYCETLPLGGNTVTKDISIGMQIDIKEAEDIKIKNGGLGLIEKDPEDTGINKHFLYQIMTARYEEILEKINEKLIYIGKDGRLAGGVIFSGGGSKVKNLASLSKDIFQLATFASEDVHMVSKELQTNMQFINALGAYTRSSKHTNTTRGIGIDFRVGKDIAQKIGNFFKKLF